MAYFQKSGNNRIYLHSLSLMAPKYHKNIVFLQSKAAVPKRFEQSTRVNRGMQVTSAQTFGRVGRRHRARQHTQPLPTACKKTPKEPARAMGHGIPTPSCQACPTEYRQLFRCKSARTEKSLCAASGDASNWPDVPSSGMGCSRFS